MFLAGYHRMSYTHDSIVGGHLAQVIDRLSMVQYPQPSAPYWSEPVESHTPVAVITREADEVIYVWSGSDASWDTLYWFGAAPGDHWYPAHWQDDLEQCGRLLVADTGSTVVDGILLHWLEVNDQLVYERMGPTWDMFLYCPHLIIDGPMGMRCYSDEEMSFNFTQFDCGTLVGVEAVAAARTSVYPNPGSVELRMDLAPGVHVVVLVDGLGREVLRKEVLGPHVAVGMQHLRPGVYNVLVDGSRAERWMKQ